ncbi:MAG TPA: PLP-dependent aminotransferase family protein [Thermoanaerobaculia bacterium]|nr:PLP-dependent aminotransferase family protein [Thermoanaerobaculia bacterium]
MALALQEDVSAGRLQAGARLPTHRELARALKTTVVTASRAYREAADRGLVRGELGRGTFVAPAAGGAPVSAGPDLIELTANFVTIRSGLPAAPRPASAGGRLFWEELERRYPPGGGAEHRSAGAAWVRRGTWAPRAAEVVVTSGAQHAILVALAALARPGGVVYAEALTYPGIKAAARTLGLELRAVAIDEQGLVPAALAEQCAGRQGGVLFCQPSLHNPTSAVMPEARRHELAALARQREMMVIEDAAYEFLLPDPPPALASLAPERTCYIVSCGKAFVPGLRVGYLISPEQLVPRLQAEVAATGLVAAPTLVDLATRWIVDGSASAIAAAKRREAQRRQEIAGAVLGAWKYASHPASSHLWLELPAPWSVGPFVEEARRRGVAVNPAAVFAADPAATPVAVRICLGPVAERDLLAEALARIAQILAAPPPPQEPVV